MRNLPRLTVVHDEFYVEELEMDIIVVEPERMINITLKDEEGNPIPGIPVHAHMNDGTDDYDAFGITDGNGFALIPAKSGHWHIHASHSTLRRAGMRQIPEAHLMVPPVEGGEASADPINHEFTATPFSDEPPVMPTTRVEGGTTLVVEGKGEPGNLYDVEGSFDLLDWLYVGRVIALDGEFAITDPINAGHQEEVTDESGDRIFYRLVKRR
jgi:hypothetical protein